MEFQARTTERTRLQNDLLTPLGVVFCIACLILFFMSSSVPGQFAGRHFSIPAWAAAIAGVALTALAAYRLLRLSHYEISDSGIAAVSAVSRNPIRFEDITEVISSPSGLVKIVSNNGATTTFAPVDLANFLREIERQIHVKRLNVPVNREVRVQIGD